jgi:thymidylate synthase (FAD)
MEVELLAISPGAEGLIERAGRTCYMSQDRIGEESAAGFVRMIISRGHHSVLEHAYATFRVSGISRAATHQLVRHRLCSFSQRSQRYVKEEEGDFVIPPSIGGNPEALRLYSKSVEDARGAYRQLLAMGVRKEDARFLMPNATASEIVLSANFRELRHIILVRGSKEAQWEARDIAVKMLGLLKDHAPNVFFDMTVGPEGYVRQDSEDTGF